MDVAGESIPRTLDWKEKTSISSVHVELFEQGGRNIDIDQAYRQITPGLVGNLPKFRTHLDELSNANMTRLDEGDRDEIKVCRSEDGFDGKRMLREDLTLFLYVPIR